MENQHLKILLVAGNGETTAAVFRAFAREPETTIIVATTLREFQHLAAVADSRPPDLVIMDWELPDGQAGELLFLPFAQVPYPVLLLVAADLEEAGLLTLPAGALDYQVKSPGGMANLPAKVRRVLREWELLQEKRTSTEIIEQLTLGWQQSLDAIPYPVFIRNNEGVVSICNQSTLNFFGKSRPEIIGARCWEFVHQTAAAFGACPMPAMLRSRQRETMIMPVAERIFQVAVDPVLAEDGAIVGAVHSMEDITEQQRREETLQAQEAELAAIYENAPSVMMLVDSDCKVRKVNQLAVSLTGVNLEGLVGCRGGEVLGCSYAGNHPQGCGFGPQCGGCTAGGTVHDTITTGRSHYNVEVVIPRSSPEGDKDLPFLLSTTRIILRGETLALVSFTNISQLKQAEESLRRNNAQMRAILDSLNALIYVADMSTYELLFVNKFGREVWGEIEGKICWQTLQSGQAGPCPFCTNDKLIRPDGTPTGVYTWEFQNTKNGHWYDCRDQAIPWSDGHLVRIEIATDITASKTAEEQLRHSQKMDTIGTLAGGIAHDFNNILTSILGFANLSLDDLPPNSQAAKDIKQVILSGQRAKELVKQILTFSRQRAEVCQPVQASLMVKEALKMLRSSIPATINIMERIIAREQIIMIDPTKLHQVVMNLCTNAYQAMPGGGTLSVALEPVVFAEETSFGREQVAAGDYLRLTVADTGCGMERAILERVFEPYFTTKSQEEGSGLGLAVVHGIIQNSQGFLAVQSAPGEGSVFQVLWPVVKQQSRLPEQASLLKYLPRGNEKVLLVDDEAVVLQVNERELRTLGYLVTSRPGPLEALETFRQSPEAFSLVITDYAMPGLDGLGLAQRLVVINPRVKIIMLTGFSEVISQETMASYNIKKLLLKPVLRKELAVAIRTVLDDETSGIPEGEV